MKPLDPRLLRHARSARRYVLLTTLLGAVTALLVVAQCFLIAQLVAPVVIEFSPAPTAGAGLPLGQTTAPVLLGVLVAVFAARVLLLVVQETFAHRAARDAIGELRGAVLDRAAALGPRWIASEEGTATTSLLTRGLDDLEAYFVRYLPQLFLAAIVTPVLLAVAFGLDLTTALTMLFTLPLIPIFMILIGRLTASYAAEKLETMERLGAQLLDLLAGLTTLVTFGRERGPAGRVRELGAAYTRTTMTTLRVAFLSSAVLEFLTSLSVALVAVGVGMRLVYGAMDLTTGLICIMLAPEVYKPLREVGAQFHASADGVAAAERAFAVLETPLPQTGTAPAPDLAATDIVLTGLGVLAPGRGVMAPAGLDGRIEAGRLTALVGPSGAGKSTAASVVLGLLRPDEGAVLLEPRTGAGGAGGSEHSPEPERLDLRDVDPASWWDQVTWVPQRPMLLPGTIRENVLGDVSTGPNDLHDPDGMNAPAHDAHDAHDALAAAARATGLAAVVAGLPEGWETRIGHGGVGLSVGQRQRVALTRALLDRAPLVVLDEPTAHLDARSEEDVLRAVGKLRAQGRTILVVAHRDSLVARADAVLTVASRTVPSPADEGVRA